MKYEPSFKAVIKYNIQKFCLANRTRILNSHAKYNISYDSIMGRTLLFSFDLLYKIFWICN